MTVGDTNLRLLLDTASYLNSRLTVQNQEDLYSKTFLKEESIEGKKVILQDIKDSTETYNREYIERDKDLQANPSKTTLTSIQDYSLFILFGGFAIFVITILVYILSYSNSPVFMTIMYLLLICLIYVLLVFLIQRYG
jgi:hypothetical protein